MSSNLLNASSINLATKIHNKQDNKYNLFKIVYDENTSTYKVSVQDKIPLNCIVHAGSFNPVHEGHYLVCIKSYMKIKKELINRNIEKNIIFELSAGNFQKPSITNSEILKRINIFLNPNNNPSSKINNKMLLNKVNSGMNNNLNTYTFYICITNAPYFREKVDIFPEGTIFAVGADTFVRIISPPSPNIKGVTIILEDLKKIKDKNCLFVVANRQSINNKNEKNNKKIKGNYKRIILGQITIFKDIISEFLKYYYYNSNTNSENISIDNLVKIYKKITDTSTKQSILDNLIKEISKLIADISIEMDDFNINQSSSALRKIKNNKNSSFAFVYGNGI